MTNPSKKPFEKADQFVENDRSDNVAEGERCPAIPEALPKSGFSDQEAVSGLGDTIKEALKSSTQSQITEDHPVLEQGDSIDIDELPDYLRDEVFLEQTFYTLESGGLPLSDSQTDQPDFPPVSNEPLTIPAPPDWQANRLPLIPPDIIDDSGSKAEVLRIPNLAVPKLAGLPHPSPRDPTINEQETVAPPPRPDGSPQSISDYLQLDDNRETADFTADAQALWKFMESDLYKQYEQALRQYEQKVLSEPKTLKPELVEYLALFHTIYQKKDS